MEAVDPRLWERIISALMGPIAAFMLLLGGYCCFMFFSFIFVFIIGFLPEGWYSFAVIVSKPFFYLWGFVMENGNVLGTIYFSGAVLLGFFKPRKFWKWCNKFGL